MTPSPFDTIAEIRRRSTEAIIGQSGLKHPGLNAEIRARFSSQDWTVGGLMQEPVLEAALPYVAAGRSLDDLSGELLHPKLVAALAGDNDPRTDYRFNRSQSPYTHQLEAWRLLRDPEAARSVLVTSGTGSGKTECFLVPILDDLVRQAEASPHRLEGVQAIMLYPLNALIASQEERLKAWTAPFEGSVRFALYNGLLPDQVPASEAAMRPETVCDRRVLRAAPPPILVTNVTMLEYMLLRPEDARILRASQGRLRYIVLDEAHSYVGAQAAEIALLLRRVCLAFDVDPAQVRFIATSATIGQGAGVDEALHKFLVDVSGAPGENVHVIKGQQRRPSLPPLNGGGPTPDVNHFAHFGGHPRVRPLLERLYGGPTSWSEVRRTAAEIDLSPEELAVKIAHAVSDDDEHLAPLRVHSFHRAVPGLWSCLDPKCLLARPKDWPFGSIHHEPADVCVCGAPLMEIVACSSCGEAFLDVEETPDGRLVRPLRGVVQDEFATDADGDASSDDVDADEDITAPRASGDRKLVALQPLQNGFRWLCVEPATGIVHDREGAPGVIRLAAYDRISPDWCPSCVATARPGNDLIRPIRFGAPFILGNATPVLLEGAASPREAQNVDTWRAMGAPPPMQGRQLLSFTDSRQGTARLSAKLQIASERAHVRSVIYHAVQAAQGRSGDASATKKLDDEIDALRTALEASPLPALEGMLKDAQARRADLASSGAKGLPWDEVVARLAERSEVKVWIKAIWDKRDRAFANETKLAEFLLLREFVRRPPRANSPETLGLARLRFDTIDRVPAAVTPTAFSAMGGSDSDWRDFLYLLMTFQVRGRSAIRVPHSLLHWIPPKASPKELVHNSDHKLLPWEVAWPKLRAGALGRPPLVVNLLAQAFDRSLADPATREDFNEIFASAWAALGTILSTPGATNRQVAFDRAHIAPVANAWFCPITRRILDVSFRGLTPYGAKSPGQPPVKAEPVVMPALPAPFLGFDHDWSAAEGRARILEWIASDPIITDLRSKGVWGDVSDRIALFSDYFRSAEHSAQQPPRKLRNYENQFRNGAINVLNCSTTMEMGVDIGSVSHVMMTNLPPSIANYRQRVGRAGRRGQPLSMGFTFCKDRPLDRDAFRQPAKFLTRSVRAPQVALGSRVIVQRHVNALLYAAFIREHGGDAMKMQVGPFFGCNSAMAAQEETDNGAVQMAAWVRREVTRSTLASSLERLTRNSILEGDLGVFEAAAQAMESARAGFAAEWRATQALAVGTENDKAARTSLSFQLRRLCEDYLLSVLASRGVLPGHGFPTGVVSFITRTDEIDKTQTSEERSRFNAYPQRALDAAIREYAPGSEVVLDGLVHKSAGVTLNWKRPASVEGVRDVQALMWRWRCGRCGESGTTRHHDLEHRDCPSCLSSPAEWSEYLQPAGFAVDLREDPHADADVVSYVPPEPAAVSAVGASWLSLFDPAVGRRRANSDGSVFFCNAGAAGTGFSICLSCGRADAPAGEIHAPLLGSGSECEGSHRPFARKERLKLGHQINTDVFEFQPAGWNELGGALALAVALREALARLLGIEPDEMGVAAERRLDALASQTASLFLFDKATGGAGFATKAQDLFSELLKEAERILDCPITGCIKGCPACVLVADLSDEEVSRLDRGTALALVRDRLLSDAAPPPDDRAAVGAKFTGNLNAEINAALEAGGVTAVFRLRGELDPARLEAWSAAALARDWSQRGRRVVLGVDKDALSHLDGSQRLRLRDLANRWNVDLEQGNDVALENGARLVAEVIGSTGVTVFASRDRNTQSADSEWGRPLTHPVVRFNAAEPNWAGLEVPRDQLQPPAGAIVRHIGSELDGPMSSFGVRTARLLKDLIDKSGISGNARLSRFEYEDRYLRSPLTVRLCLGVLGGLAKAYGDAPPLTVRTSPLEFGDRPSQWLDNNWRRESDRSDVATALARSAGLVLDFQGTRAGHARRLTLSYADGSTCQILFDQGFGAWRCERGVTFGFSSSVPDQVKRLRTVETRVYLPSDAKTFVVCETSFVRS
jgi:ATP-dependent helicase YprA (DUF1998 family)